MELNETKLHDLLGKVVTEMGAAANGPLVTIGDKLGLYKTLSESGWSLFLCFLDHALYPLLKSRSRACPWCASR